MQIYDKPLGWLTPYENNPRNNDEAVEPVANSISEFGFKVPIVATSDGEIINGHTRWKAAKKLKLKTVPVIIADDLTEEQVRAFRLADNKVAEIAQWDIELLLSEIESVDNLDMTIQNDSMDDASFRQFLRDAFSVADQHLKPGGAFYIWHADSEGLNFRAAVKETGWLLKQNLVWVKNSIVLGRQDYQWKHEPCLYGWKDGASHYFIDNRSLATVIEEDEENLKEMTKGELISYIKTMQESSPTSIFYEDKPVRSDIHPTMKPLKLIARCVLNSSKKGERVLDSFNGGGSTLMVCEKTERIYYGMELDPVYVERTIKRWEEETGLKAEKIN